MSAGYVRRWTQEQSAATYLAIESVNVIDLAPPSTFAGVPFGRALLVGEFEDGPFATPTLVADEDLGEGKTFGGFGFSYQGVRYKNVCARQRKADGAVKAEPFNGSGFIQMQGKKFSSLVLSRVDTSVGNVEFTRCAYIDGSNQPFFTLQPAQTLVFNFGNIAANTTATFNATPASVTGSAAVFANITAGMNVTLAYDAQPAFQTTFLTGDTAIANVAARINQYAGFTFASSNAGQLELTGRQAGTGGRVFVVSASANTLADLGLSVGQSNGGGNVSNISSVTPTELNTIVSAANADATVTVLSDGTIRLTDVADGASGKLEVLSVSTAVNLGFAPLDTTVTAAAGNDGIIPAGTQVSVANGPAFVTMQTITVAAANAGPYSVKVRHALDDGSGANCSVSTANVLPLPIDVDAYTVTNPLPISAALTESQIDAAYTLAFDACEDVNTPAKQVNVSWSARQSNSTRRELRADALSASATGLFGRVACLRTPMGLSKASAMSTSAEPGVGPYRNERVLFCYPQASVIIEAIQATGVAGGNGFTATGQIDIGADGFLASSISQLPAGENPAQDAGFLTNIVSLESGAPTGLSMDDYIAFKAAGIVALRMDDGEAVFQSGVTSVDPLVQSSQTDIERRTLADFIEDSMAVLAAPYSKKKMTAAAKAAVLDAWKNFLDPLLGDADGNNQVLDSYSLIPKSTPAMLAQGRYRVQFKGRSVPSFKSIELSATVGAGVIIDETP